MSNIIPMNYDDRSFPFTADCWFNATVAAKHHGKLPKDWLKTEATKIYIAELAEELGIAGTGVKEDFSPLLVRVEKGRNGGTWLHPELAVEFARWLSVKFARACDRHIKNLLLSKNFQLTEDQIVGLMVCQQPTSWEKRFKDPFYQALSKMSGLPYFGHVGGCPALFGQITARWVYGVALPDYVYQAAKQAAGDSKEKIHQHLKPDALEKVEQQLIAVTNIASCSIDQKDFEARCMAAFPVKGQMKLLYAAA
ncbi:TPA: KilA-N domain-containing protein [Klebsiella pneumoniae]|uniref:KilA-N domain-containing protein n=1 Tax=Klebsiella pneumoniae TaxID=573 RepID=UPI001C96EBE6|nr:KilA-N domain-containing protein [Klebsiella pneumoniae]MBY5213376.1 DNA-binding protein [Klebsiella pneumoniae]HBU8916490.1 KilA-N domain-containing protein [Klebsiella pneumoniae]HBU9116328.1 KilA-N domain-containing protein [Klebsiella pneumoniae]HBV5367407.1 KilA-N domain-containing protein [Klebsiella pneumoniae]